MCSTVCLRRHKLFQHVTGEGPLFFTKPTPTKTISSFSAILFRYNSCLLWVFSHTAPSCQSSLGRIVRSLLLFTQRDNCLKAMHACIQDTEQVIGNADAQLALRLLSIHCCLALPGKALEVRQSARFSITKSACICRMDACMAGVFKRASWLPCTTVAGSDDMERCIAYCIKTQLA